MLELAHKKLYWPKPDQIWTPSGSGPRVYAELAREKIGEKIKREFPKDAKGVKVSVLAANPDGDETEAPIAIVCQFSKSVSSAVIKEVHRLAWSFSRARSLITIEPHLLRVWSCCEPPTENGELKHVIRVTEANLSEQAANALQWVELVSGQFFQENEDRFKRSGAADQMLLDNLKEVREQLQKDGLDVETIHDLLARIIFIQFLFQKQDAEGTRFLNEYILENLHTQKVLSKSYKELPDILDNFDDTYNLFRWLNDKFNGDLFPGKGETEKERESEWQAEIQKVRVDGNKYLKKLADFARGDLQMKDKQLCLWKFYSFDVIPLDFISSIYEEFVKKKPVKKKESNQEPKIKKIKGKDTVHYTPEYIVDFILDGVLPWDDEEWNLKILDPACGSGIFLVKAFQRLIYRWELAHKVPISVNTLRSLLENNIFGVDIDKEAVRVASFSLYMMMIDSIDPLKYWDKEVCFPRLRNRQLFNADFFEENKEGFRTNEDAATYDLVLGNAPWCKNSITNSEFAKSWEEREENEGKWKTSYGNIGPLFLPKAAALTKCGGTVTMMQPAMPLLFNQSGPAKKFRNQLFSEFKIQEIVNLSALRFGLFKDAISPTCIVTFLNLRPDLDALTYVCPKASLTDQDNYHIIIEPQDINLIYPDEAISFPSVWATLMWGGRRDLAFISSLSKYPTISSLSKKGVCVYSQGIKKGAKTAKKVRFEPLRDRRFLQADNFPEGTGFYLRADKLPINRDVDVEGPRIENHDAFNLPQLIIKQSWVTKLSRFTASLVTENPPTQQGVLCKESFVSVHTDIENIKWLESACLTYNSKLAVYYLFLTSGRFASFIHEIKPTELVKVPLPKAPSDLLQNINYLDDIDALICQLFSFKNSEWSLVEDLTKYTLLDFKGNKLSCGRQKTRRAVTNLLENDDEKELKEYCNYFLRVIKAGFGEDKEVCATIFQEESNDYLPVRLVAIYLNKSIHDGIKVETINSQDLLKRLNQLNNLFIEQPNSHTNGGIFYQRVVRLYASTEWQGEQVPTVYLIKPDKVRYWTRSMALRDADEVSADIMSGYTHLTKESETLPITHYD
jgi:type I restriction-modification system DNA methylase subunit